MGADESNVVHLVGRVSAILQQRVLPSGDAVLPLRIVVPRPPTTGSAASGASGGSRVTVDVIDVACWSSATRRVAARLKAGDRVEVRGSLHRRFFRSGGGGVQSRYEVAAERLGRLSIDGEPGPGREAVRLSDNGVRGRQ
ncbi:MAG: single-stranded DNA-binding protein [Dermatophilaceae bacterium]